MIDPRYSLAGVLVGLVVGLTGVGGGSLMTPLLVLVFGVAPTTAVGTDLLYAAATKTVGTTVHGWRGTVDWRVVLRLAIGSVPATIVTLFALGASNKAHTGHTISVVLGAVLILSAITALFRPRIVAFLTPRVGPVGREHPMILTVLLGAVLGVMVSLTSVGAGALGMTALLILYPTLPVNKLVGSDIAHAVPLTLLAGTGHWLLGSVDGAMLVSLLCGSIPGIIVGSLISSRVSDRLLSPILATVLLLVGVKLLF
ncbi:sulfite exporter TauE/SafE family protein [Sphingomonas bacterium]|uniref:sulfite exporter TauE/SafE family protein n=1 Tax=Sphingomonas bacterium TaxID=1895847 RepID=UPI00260751D2|nr:sulfite exporter TauE/SafE family protein [Sphingomonas bacterium]MDB5677340.1 sulfite exporter TauE/SafE family protein [Sphingomonas bacterium]